MASKNPGQRAGVLSYGVFVTRKVFGTKTITGQVESTFFHQTLTCASPVPL